MLRWSERQRAMLKAMGVQHFWPTNDAPKKVPVAASAPLAKPQPQSPVAPLHNQIQGLGWPALAAAVEACQACSLCQHRKQPVLGAGNLRAHWMLVGEAPGEQEDMTGQPFVGRAGQLLDHILEASSLTRETGTESQQVHIANVIKCRPPGNRNPTPAEVQQCEPYLIRQIQLVQPKLLVAMGRFAAQTLLKTNEPIGRLRGRIHRYEDIPLVVTYHPAYLLRNPADKALAWDDWCLARQLMSTLA